jgi:hypothetical protein
MPASKVLQLSTGCGPNDQRKTSSRQQEHWEAALKLLGACIIHPYCNPGTAGLLPTPELHHMMCNHGIVALWACRVMPGSLASQPVRRIEWRQIAPPGKPGAAAVQRAEQGFATHRGAYQWPSTRFRGGARKSPRPCKARCLQLQAPARGSCLVTWGRYATHRPEGRQPGACCCRTLLQIRCIAGSTAALATTNGQTSTGLGALHGATGVDCSYCCMCSARWQLCCSWGCCQPGHRPPNDVVRGALPQALPPSRCRLLQAP